MDQQVTQRKSVFVNVRLCLFVVYIAYIVPLHSDNKLSSQEVIVTNEPDYLNFGELDFDNENGESEDKTEVITSQPPYSVDSSQIDNSVKAIANKILLYAHHQPNELLSRDFVKKSASDALSFNILNDVGEGEIKKPLDPPQTTASSVDLSQADKIVHSISPGQDNIRGVKEEEPLSYEFEKQDDSDGLHLKDLDQNDGNTNTAKIAQHKKDNTSSSSQDTASHQLGLSQSRSPVKPFDKTQNGIEAKETTNSLSESKESEQSNGDLDTSANIKPTEEYGYERQEASDGLHFNELDFDEEEKDLRNSVTTPKPRDLPDTNSTYLSLIPKTEADEKTHNESTLQELHPMQHSESLNFDSLDNDDDDDDVNIDGIKVSVTPPQSTASSVDLSLVDKIVHSVSPGTDNMRPIKEEEPLSYEFHRQSPSDGLQFNDLDKSDDEKTPDKKIHVPLDRSIDQNVPGIPTSELTASDSRHNFTQRSPSTNSSEKIRNATEAKEASPALGGSKQTEHPDARDPEDEKLTDGSDTSLDIQKIEEFGYERQEASDGLHFNELDFDEEEKDLRNSVTTPKPHDLPDTNSTYLSLIPKTEDDPENDQHKQSEPILQEFNPSHNSDSLHFRQLDFDNDHEGQEKSEDIAVVTQSPEVISDIHPFEESALPETVDVDKSEVSKPNKPLTQDFVLRASSDELSFDKLDFANNEKLSEKADTSESSTPHPVFQLQPDTVVHSKALKIEGDLIDPQSDPVHVSSLEVNKNAVSDNLHFTSLDNEDIGRSMKKSVNHIQSPATEKPHAKEEWSLNESKRKIPKNAHDHALNGAPEAMHPKQKQTGNPYVVFAESSHALNSSNRPDDGTNRDNSFINAFKMTNRIEVLGNTAQVWEINDVFDDDDELINTYDDQGLYDGELEHLKRLRRNVVNNNNNDNDDGGSGDLTGCDAGEVYLCPKCSVFGDSGTIQAQCDAETITVICDGTAASCRTTKYFNRRGSLVGVEKECGNYDGFCAELQRSSTPTADQAEGERSTINETAFGNVVAVEKSVNECLEPDGGCYACDPGDSFTCPSCNVTSDSQNVEQLCDQAASTVFCNHTGAGCRTTRYTNKRGVVIAMIKDCGETTGHCDFFQSSSTPTAGQLPGVCTTYSNLIYQGEDIAEICENQCIEPTTGCDVETPCPCPSGLKCLSCNATNENECDQTDLVNCTDTNEVCLIERNFDDRGRVIKFTSQCVDSTQHASVCATKGEFTCTDVAGQPGYENCVKCDNATCTFPDILSCDSATVQTCWHCEATDDAECTSLGFTEQCSAGQRCINDTWYDSRGTLQRIVSGCNDTCVAQPCTQDTQPRFGEIGQTCISCSNTQSTCQEDILSSTSCPVGQEPACHECSAASEAECNSTGTTVICSESQAACLESYIINLQGTLIHFNRTCAAAATCPASQCIVLGDGGMKCDACRTNKCGLPGPVACTQGTSTACRVCINENSYTACDSGTLVTSSTGVCETIEETLESGAMRISRAPSLDLSLCSVIATGHCQVTAGNFTDNNGVAVAVRRRCCAYATECLDTPDVIVTTAATPRLSLPDAITCPVNFRPQCWTCVRTASQAQCLDPNIGYWDDCGQEFCAVTEEVHSTLGTLYSEGCQTRSFCEANHGVTRQTSTGTIIDTCGNLTCGEPVAQPVVFVTMVAPVTWNSAYSDPTSIEYWQLRLQMQSLLLSLVFNDPNILFFEILEFRPGSVVTVVKYTLAENATVNDEGEVTDDFRDQIATSLVQSLVGLNTSIEINGEVFPVSIGGLYSSNPSGSFSNETNQNGTTVISDACEQFDVCENGGTCMSDGNPSSVSCRCASGYSGSICETVEESSSDLTLILVVGILGPIALVIIIFALAYCVRHLRQRPQKPTRTERRLSVPRRIKRYDQRETGTWTSRSLALTPHRGWRNYIGAQGVLDESGRDMGWDFNDGHHAPIHRSRYNYGRAWNPPDDSAGSYFY